AAADLGEEGLADRDVAEEAGEPLGVEHRVGEVALGVPVAEEAVAPLAHPVARDLAELAADGLLDQVLLGAEAEALQAGDPALERIAGGDRAPAGLDEVADEALRVLHDRREG